MSYVSSDFHCIFSTQLDSVIAYITHQPGHHRRRSFQEACVAFLKEHCIEYDEHYFWDQFSRPFGTCACLCMPPGVQTPGYYQVLPSGEEGGLGHKIANAVTKMSKLQCRLEIGDTAGLETCATEEPALCGGSLIDFSIALACASHEEYFP